MNMRNMKRIFAAALCAFMLFSTVNDAEAAAKKKAAPKKPAAPAEKLITVEAEGYAPIIDGKKNEAHDAAKRSLSREALEKALGAFVEGITEMKDFEVVKDKVFSQTRGLVKRLDIKREWVDEDNVLHLAGVCSVAEVALDGVLGPAVIDALGNPRVMVLLDERIEDKTPFLFTAEAEVLRVFEKAGYTLVDPEHAELLKDIDLTAARRSDDPERMRELARDFHADILVRGKAYAHIYNHAHRLGHSWVNTQSTVQLRAILSDTGQMVGSEAFSTRDTNGGGTVEDSAIRSLKPSAGNAASSIVHKVAYALISGPVGGVSGRTVKIKLSGMNLKAARSLRDELLDIEGVSGVYQRRLQKGELELDVNVSGKMADDVAEFLSDKGYEITGVSAGLIEGSMAE